MYNTTTMYLLHDSCIVHECFARLSLYFDRFGGGGNGNGPTGGRGIVQSFLRRPGQLCLNRMTTNVQHTVGVETTLER